MQPVTHWMLLIQPFTQSASACAHSQALGFLCIATLCCPDRHACVPAVLCCVDGLQHGTCCFQKGIAVTWLPSETNTCLRREWRLCARSSRTSGFGVNNGHSGGLTFAPMVANDTHGSSFQTQVTAPWHAVISGAAVHKSSIQNVASSWHKWGANLMGASHNSMV
ncbi:hypothetical protein COO60DRAFT_520097 [Scenedesmus sp. NREL 46B-D3]|nr:hypothetical protein COO60DRAFT_520097 [Scenedesmus sp. NREL 46B-D3]